LRRNARANSAGSPHRRNGEPVHPPTPKPARFRSGFYGSNLTTGQ